MGLQSSAKNPPRVLNLQDYRAITALDWSNPHTTRIRAALGDEKLCCAYDPNPEREGGPCWLIARLVPTQVLYSGGRTERFSEQTLCPFVIDEWRNEDGTPRSIDDPRLIGMLMRCDTSRSKYAVSSPDIDAVRLKSEKAIRDIAKQEDLRRAFAKMADEVGAVSHRKLGTEGGKISTANLWRRGAGAAQKPLILNAQGLPAL